MFIYLTVYCSTQQSSCYLNCVDCYFLLMFKIEQDPSRCRTLCCNKYSIIIATPLAPPPAARAAVHHVLPPPVGGAHFYITTIRVCLQTKVRGVLIPFECDEACRV